MGGPPAQLTRSKVKEENQTTGRLHKKKATQTAGRLDSSETAMLSTPSMKIRVEDGGEFVDTVGRTDDGRHESIVSPGLAERAVLNSIVKMTKVENLSLQVALKEVDKVQLSSFSGAWAPPCIFLHLGSCLLALTNVRFLVSDADLLAEKILIGAPNLLHLGVDTKTMLKCDRTRIDRSDYSVTDHRKSLGSISRLMIERRNRVIGNTENAEKAQARVDYFKPRRDENPFLGDSLLDPIDAEQHNEVVAEIKSMVERAAVAGLEGSLLERLNTMVWKNMNVFRVGVS